VVEFDGVFESGRDNSDSFDFLSVSADSDSVSFARVQLTFRQNVTTVFIVFSGNTVETVHEVDTVTVALTLAKWFIFANDTFESVAVTFSAFVIFTPFLTDSSVGTV